MQIALGKGDFNIIFAKLLHDGAIYLRPDVVLILGIADPGAQPHIPGGIAELHQ